MKYLITEKQYKLIYEIERESGHFNFEPLDSFYEYMYDKLPNKKMHKYFWEFFTNKMGKKIEYDDFYKSDVDDYFKYTDNSAWSVDFKSKDARSGLAYYVAKHYFGLQKGVDLEYMVNKNGNHPIFYFFDPILKIFVGRIYLAKEHGYFKNTYRVGLSAADEELIGTGYGTKMYLTVLENVDYLLSDNTLYSGSYRIWKNVLPKYVNVWGVEVEGDRWEEVADKNYTKIVPSKKTSVRKFDRFIASSKYKNV